ncbi:MAG: MlaD family protein [Chitinispirillales bacterium]|jgi:phospholipid/cholesterol/gamma-HCH transport system substrate-binding protein|nr:MlaD family protein [Chitinispirillales bacterium]
MYERKIVWPALKAGVIVTSGLGAFFMAVFFASDLSSIFSPSQRVTVHFTNASGLRPGAPVWIYGVEAGRVEKVTIAENGTLITMSVPKQFSQFINKDTEVQIMTMGLLGNKYLEIFPDSQSGDGLNPDEIIIGTEPASVNKMMSVMGMALSSLEQTAQQIQQLATNLSTEDGTINRLIKDPRVYDNFARASKKLEQVAANIDNGNGLATALIKDEELVTQLKETISTLKNTAEQLSRAAVSADSLLNEVKKNPGRFFKFSIF